MGQVRSFELEKVFILLFVLLFLLIRVAGFSWLLMLFLGNLGTNIGFWGAVPGGWLLAGLVSGNTTSTKNKTGEK